MPCGATQDRGSRWRGLTECGPLEKGMANHFSIKSHTQHDKNNEKDRRFLMFCFHIRSNYYSQYTLTFHGFKCYDIASERTAFAPDIYCHYTQFEEIGQDFFSELHEEKTSSGWKPYGNVGKEGQ